MAQKCSRSIKIEQDGKVVDAYSFGNFPLTLFLGVGAFVQINNVGGDSTGEIATQLGLRIPVGLSLWLFKNVLEIFVEVVPTINIIPDLSAFRSWQGWVGFTIALPW